MSNAFSFYIHIPYCISKCKYCDFFSKPVSTCNKKIVSDEYIQALTNEIKYRIKKNNVQKLKTIYIGGGTPSLLDYTQLYKILDTVKKCCLVDKKAEITLEANPDDITKDFIDSITKCGVNRLSVGIQSLNDMSLKFVNRRSDSKCCIKALETLKKYWQGKLSIDLICGLPFETENSFIAGIKQIIDYNPVHISMYSLTIEDETVLGQMYNNNEFSYDWDFADSLWLKGRDFLKTNGYYQYEVSNFCLSDSECEHNLAYWNHSDYLGVGAGATGTVYPKRWTNTTNLQDYIDFWNGKITENEIPEVQEQIENEISKFEFFMMGLRKLKGISDVEYKSLFNENIPSNIIEVFAKWQRRKLLNISKSESETRYALNQEGILFLNKLLEEIEF